MTLTPVWVNLGSNHLPIMPYVSQGESAGKRWQIGVTVNMTLDGMAADPGSFAACGGRAGLGLREARGKLPHARN